MKYITPLYFGGIGVALYLSGCSSVTGGNMPTTASQQTGTVHAMVSDDPTENWATIGVKVLKVSLTPQGGGTPVTIYTAPAAPPVVNLVQEDALDDLMGADATVPAGTYTAAAVTLGANNDGTNCDVTLIAGADPDDDLDIPKGTAVPCSDITIAGAQGAAPSMTVPVNVTLETPLTVTAGSASAVDFDFDLNHPALIVEHMPAGATSPTFVVNFNGPVKHHDHPDLRKISLRHLYGQVASVKSDNTAITIDRAFPAVPITSPETATVDTGDTLNILADSTNGTIFLDLDTSTGPTTIMNFSSVASTLSRMYVRIAARYQQDGTLVATRILAASTFDKVWQNPEGHILHVNNSSNTMWVTTDDGKAKQIAIGPNTSFIWQATNTTIGTGSSFFDGMTPGGLPNIARGFKVAVTIDPLSTAKPPVAETVEIGVARYNGTISSPTNVQFDYTRDFDMRDGRGGKDDYSGSIDYATGSLVDQVGATVAGFYWWNFGFPTLEDTAPTAVPDFVKATGGSVDFGGTVGVLKANGVSDATWSDSAAANTWSATNTVLMPVPAPLGRISTAFSTGTDSFALTVPLPKGASSGTPAAKPVNVVLNTTAGSATYVYQIDRQGGDITITPQDISNASTLATVAQSLVVNTPVKVFGIPQPDGSLKAYVLFYYTHTPSGK